MCLPALYLHFVVARPFQRHQRLSESVGGACLAQRQLEWVVALLEFEGCHGAVRHDTSVAVVDRTGHHPQRVANLGGEGVAAHLDAHIWHANFDGLVGRRAQFVGQRIVDAGHVDRRRARWGKLPEQRAGGSFHKRLGFSVHAEVRRQLGDIGRIQEVGRIESKRDDPFFLAAGRPLGQKLAQRAGAWHSRIVVQCSEDDPVGLIDQSVDLLTCYGGRLPCQVRAELLG